MVKHVCTLSCPRGSTLEPFKTANVEYTCLFEIGEYEPKHIPQCTFGMKSNYEGMLHFNNILRFVFVFLQTVNLLG